MGDETPVPTEHCLVIGISGCSSAGKSTTGFLLQHVIEQALTNDNSVSGQVLLFQQDSYFIDRKESPSVVIRRDNGSGVGVESGPNRDCIESVDFPKLEADIRKALASEEARREFASRFSEDEKRQQAKQAALARVADLTEAMSMLKEVLAAYKHRGQTAPSRFIIVEGFLLSAQQPSGGLGQVVEVSQELPRDTAEERIAALARILQLIECRMFLFTRTGEIAKKRRFGRWDYILGQGRTPDQFWKTEAYFDQVAWPLFDLYHKELLAVITKDTSGGYHTLDKTKVFVKASDDESYNAILHFAIKCIASVRGAECS